MVDEMTELLPSPLYFLSYVDRRVEYDDRVMASNEHVVFGYHLKKNLWLEKNVGLAGLMDDWGVEVDVAMLARRTDVPGAKVPSGILTAARRSKIGGLIRCIENSDDPVVIDLGTAQKQLRRFPDRSLLQGPIEYAARHRASTLSRPPGVRDHAFLTNRSASLRN